MAVPMFFEFFKPFLSAINDGQVHSLKDVRERVANDLKLSKEDIEEMLPSNKQRRFDNRIAWSRTYLDRAGLIETVDRGKYKITLEGMKALSSNEKIDRHYLEKFESYKSFKSLRHDRELNDNQANDIVSPEEELENAFMQISSSLEEDLLLEVKKLDPKDFEKVVLKLLLKMGYGSDIDGAAQLTPITNDEGIDGIIKEDILGFDNVYIQAKRWKEDTVIGRTEIQKFVGALQGKQAQKGIFITTSRFADTAKDFIKLLSNVKVVLIDGKKLSELMVKYNLGVYVEQVFEIKKIDRDFFNDDINI